MIKYIFIKFIKNIMTDVLMEAIIAACWVCLVCCILGQILICYMKRKEKYKVQPVIVTI